MIHRPIGYYVHHHGAGHLARARAIAGAADGDIVLLGTGIGALGVDLADDRSGSGAFDGNDAAITRPDALHYAPLDHPGIRSRVATIARWIEALRPSLMVVDVSVEIAMLARLASVPVVYVRLNGDRSDTPHLEAFRGAVGLLAPFHRDLDTPSTPRWVTEKTCYLPGITSSPPPKAVDTQRTVLVAFGRGGEAGDGEGLARAARHCPSWQWRVIGPCSSPRDLPANLAILGWVQDAGREIAAAAVVVGAAGDGLVGSILAADRPFVCIPESRPFDEQRATALGLARSGAAVVLPQWPKPESWAALMEEALALRPEARRRLHDPAGADAAARWIRSMAQTAGKVRDRAA